MKSREALRKQGVGKAGSRSDCPRGPHHHGNCGQQVADGGKMRTGADAHHPWNSESPRESLCPSVLALFAGRWLQPAAWAARSSPRLLGDVRVLAGIEEEPPRKAFYAHFLAAWTRASCHPTKTASPWQPGGRLTCSREPGHAPAARDPAPSGTSPEPRITMATRGSGTAARRVVGRRPVGLGPAPKGKGRRGMAGRAVGREVRAERRVLKVQGLGFLGRGGQAICGSPRYEGAERPRALCRRHGSSRGRQSWTRAWAPSGAGRQQGAVAARRARRIPPRDLRTGALR